ncbi:MULTISPECIES: DsbA family oxidoreductase [Bacillus]|uniref:DsbA family oxidoreductase n=1 Tax=Bacillus TaxID=1386 RepID=UPI0027E4485A|nr:MULTISPECIES: DsbA family protein [Bacillus]
MAEAPLKEAIKEKENIELEWMPFELRPLPYETLSPKSEKMQQGWKSSIKPLSERFGVNMKLPDIDPMPHTHFAHEGYQFAKENGKGNEYVEAVLEAFWRDGKNIGSIDELTEIAASIGLERDAFQKALEDRNYERAHKQALRHAYEEAAITAVPTFFIGSQRVQGLNTKETLEAIIDQESAK